MSFDEVGYAKCTCMCRISECRTILLLLLIANAREKYLLLLRYK